ncbi:DUF5980 family protein [Micromonospora sp. DT201]|uniref:DUF5980 family protein n=1 Tax=Micromonospora sp. DT201 TaxID=3393442 RepID=UPI003CEA0993
MTNAFDTPTSRQTLLPILAAFRLSDGRYVPQLWATDGTDVQSIPVTLDIRVRC